MYSTRPPFGAEVLIGLFRWLVSHRRFVGVVLAVGLIAAGFVVFQYFLNLIVLMDDKETLMNRNKTGIVIEDRNGNAFYQFYDVQNSEFVELVEIPEHVQQAFIAAEDKDFYQHSGFSIKAIARATAMNASRGGIVNGGSTITQQFVKNTLLTSTQTYQRKIQEVVLAMALEQKYSKEDILEMYLNSVYFGGGAYGVEAAAQTYFGKSVTNISLAEASLLAAIVPSPSRLSPIGGNREEAFAAREGVLDAMLAEAYITLEERAAAAADILTIPDSSPTRVDTDGAHFALMVRDALNEQYGEDVVARSGFRIKTTLDLDLQRQVQAIVAEEVTKLEKNRVTNAATVVLDARTGEIRALVGSRDWEQPDFGKFNMAIAPRQPGSSFKPLVYATALDRGVITPGTVLRDVLTTYPGQPEPYAPKNYDNRFRGPMLPRRALANSINVPAVEIMHKTGLTTVLDTVEQMGVTTLADRSRFGLSLVLGAGEVSPLEMAGAYAVFANGGQYVAPKYILEIYDKFGNRIFQDDTSSQQVISPETAFLISSFLSDPQARSEVFGRNLTISRPAAAKTGTTSNYRDAWTIGYTPSLVTAVWVGNNDNTEMDRVAGSLGAAPIWRRVMTLALEGTPVEEFVSPAGLVRIRVCSANGLRATSAFGGTYEEFFRLGTEPTGLCRSAAEIQKEAEEKQLKEDEKKKQTEEEQRKQLESATPPVAAPESVPVPALTPA